MATLKTFSPIAETVSLRDAVDELFRQSVVRSQGERGARNGQQPWRLPLDVFETAEGVVVRSWAPGATPDTVNIAWEQGTLTVSAIMPASDTADSAVAWHTRELPSGEARATVALPASLDADRAEAAFDAGVLTIRIPKAAAARPKTIRIGAQASA